MFHKNYAPFGNLLSIIVCSKMIWVGRKAIPLKPHVPPQLCISEYIGFLVEYGLLYH